MLLWKRPRCLKKRLMALAALAVIMLISLFQAGCWDRLEPDVLGIVTVVAFDLDAETGLFTVYAQVANPLGGGTQQDGDGGGGQGKSSIWVVEATGHTVFEAIKNMELISTRRLQWANVEAVLFSERLAREGIRPVLDILHRERQIRLISRPFVVQGDLRRLVEAEFPLEQVGGTAASKLYFTARGETSFTPEIDSLRVLFRHFSLPGIDAILPRAVVIAGGGDEGEAAGRPNPVRIGGAAVFRGEKLAGFLDERETSGYLWLTGKTKRSTMVLPCPENEEEFLTVEAFDATAKLTPLISGDEVRFKASISVPGRIQDST